MTIVIYTQYTIHIQHNIIYNTISVFSQQFLSFLFHLSFSIFFLPNFMFVRFFFILFLLFSLDFSFSFSCLCSEIMVFAMFSVLQHNENLSQVIAKDILSFVVNTRNLIHHRISNLQPEI